MNAKRKIKTPLPSVAVADKPARLSNRRRNVPPPELTEREVAALASGAKLIPLTQNKWAIVDAEDYEWLSEWTWNAAKRGNAFYAVGQSPATRAAVYMHRALTGEKGMCVDHRDGDGLNNRRANLRECTRAQNTRNRRPSSLNTSGRKGVDLVKRNLKKPYRAFIKFNYKRIHLGFYATADEAAAAYNEASARLHGEFARPS